MSKSEKENSTQFYQTEKYFGVRKLDLVNSDTGVFKGWVWDSNPLRNAETYQTFKQKLSKICKNLS